MSPTLASVSPATRTPHNQVIEWPLPLQQAHAGALGPMRTGESPLERAALERLSRVLASVPVPMLARFLIWPDDGIDFARAAGLRTTGQYYNCLRRAQGRRQLPVRRKIERWARLSRGTLDVIDVPRCRIGQSPRAGERDGTSQLERATLERVRENLAQLPARMVLELVLWPFDIPDLARELGREARQIHNTLQGGLYRYPQLRRQLADFLGGDYVREWLDHLIDAETPEPPPAPCPENGTLRLAL